jgi:hypothetical protein
VGGGAESIEPPKKCDRRRGGSEGLVDRAAVGTKDEAIAPQSSPPSFQRGCMQGHAFRAVNAPERGHVAQDQEVKHIWAIAAAQRPKDRAIGRRRECHQSDGTLSPHSRRVREGFSTQTRRQG